MLKKLGIIAVAAAATAILVAFVLRKPEPPKRSTATLADGTQIIIQAVTYGTNHNFVHGSRFWARMKPNVPGPLRRWVPDAYATKESTSREYLVVWYSAYDPVKRTYVAVQCDEMHLVDEHGCAFRTSLGGTQSSSTFSVARLYADVFPRRRKTFTLRAKFAKYPIVDLQILNPLVPNTSEWNPEPLPATRRTNDLTVVLKRLRSNKEFNYVWSEFAFEQDGAPRDEWYASCTFHDTTGNSDYRPLCRFERAWKVQADIYKTAQASFRESEISRVFQLRLPESGVPVILTNQMQFANIWVRPIALCGSGDFVFSNEVCIVARPWQQGDHETFSSTSSGMGVLHRFTSKKPTLLARVDGWRTSEQLLIRLRTRDDGTRSFGFRGSADNMCRFELDKPIQAGQAVDLEFIPQQPLRFEFTVAPPQLRADKR